MSDDRFERAAAIFLEARRFQGEDRAEFVRRACAGDADLTNEVDALLRGDADPSPVEKIAAGIGRILPGLGDAKDLAAVRTRNLDRDRTPPAGRRIEERATIGPYKILQAIGEGGFGTVYMAEQTEPVRRLVALKIVKPGMDTRQVIARFEAEEQALALMDHPNIARVFDAGVSESGRPYFVMELVRGVPITEYADSGRLSTRERLELLLPVCMAVHHAHQKGVIHRDLKPSNILVTLHDGKPVPKVIDFGIAKAMGPKLTDKTLFTEFRQFIGTPEYMSPEQAEMSGLDIDVRTDVYSLGVLTYEMLTGTTPFAFENLRASTPDRIQKVLREREPDRPSTRLSAKTPVRGLPPAGSNSAAARPGDRELPSDTGTDHDSSVERLAHRRRTTPQILRRSLRGEIDWIVMRCLEKDRTRRYDGPAALAADIRAHLENRPIDAGPPSSVYRFRKLVARNSGLVAALAGVLITLVVGAAIAFSGYVEASRERDVARLATKAAERAAGEATMQMRSHEALTAFLREMLSAASPESGLGAGVTVRYILDRTARKLDAGELRNEPAKEAAVRETIGSTYRALRILDEAERHLHLALEMRLRLYGENHADTIASLLELGTLRLDRVECPVGLSLYDRAVRASEVVFGASSLETVRALTRKAVALDHCHDPDAALALLDRTSERLGTIVDKDVAEAAEIDVQRALILAKQGKAAAAEKLLDQAAERRRRLFGPRHPSVADVLVDIAALGFQRGAKEEARGLYREALAAYRQAYGQRSYAVAATLNKLGAVAWSLFDFDEADQSFRESIELHRIHLGADDLAIAEALSNHALLLRDAGRLGDAERALKEALAIAETSRSAPGAPLSAVVVTARVGLGWVHFMQKNLGAAARVLAEASAQLEGSGASPVLLADVHDVKGRIALAAGNPKDALEDLRKALALTQEAGFGGGLRAALLHAALAGTYAVLGRLDDADQAIDAVKVDGIEEATLRSSTVRTALLPLVEAYRAVGEIRSADLLLQRLGRHESRGETPASQSSDHD